MIFEGSSTRSRWFQATVPVPAWLLVAAILAAILLYSEVLLLPAIDGLATANGSSMAKANRNKVGETLTCPPCQCSRSEAVPAPCVPAVVAPVIAAPAPAPVPSLATVAYDDAFYEKCRDLLRPFCSPSKHRILALIRLMAVLVLTITFWPRTRASAPAIRR